MFTLHSMTRVSGTGEKHWVRAQTRAYISRLCWKPRKSRKSPGVKALERRLCTTHVRIAAPSGNPETIKSP